jgi:hypothetical protein
MFCRACSGCFCAVATACLTSCESLKTKKIRPPNAIARSPDVAIVIKIFFVNEDSEISPAEDARAINEDFTIAREVER